MIQLALGAKGNPHTIAPDDWHENGVEYGAYCKCWSCSVVRPSTVMFDYYAKKPGDPLRCEACSRAVWANKSKEGAA